MSASTEQAIVSAKASVMVYDDLTKKWNPSGSSPGLSKVYIYLNPMNQTYRVVGRKIQDHEFVINCMLSKGIKYQANQNFLQWRDLILKQVYGLHFQSKDETDTFAKVLKTAVDNLVRVAASSNSSSSNNSANGIMNGNSDNISVGKRSISSEYNNPLIYDDNDRQNNFNNNNGHNGHNNIYTGINTQRNSQSNQHVTSPPLSNSSSSSSSTISSNGLTVNTINGISNGHNTQNNGHGQQIIGYHTNQQQHNPQNGYHINQNNHIFNLQHQQQNQQINTSSTSSSSSSSNSSTTQQPLYQSSPIPPPPPPPPAAPPAIFNTNQNGFNHINTTNNNHHANDNFSQKIYDVIPDTTNYIPNQQNNIASNNNSAPPPPPLPTNLFSTQTNVGGGPPPPPPPIASMQSLNINSNSNSNSNSNNQNSNNNSNSNNLANDLARSIANRQPLKKVEQETRQTAPPQLDFLTEIRQKLEAKNLGNNGTSNENENLKPSNGLKKISRNNISSDSPKPIKKITSAATINGNINNTTSNNNNNISNLTNGLDSQSYDKLKQELLSEFRKELQVIKSDIVNSILNELRR